MRPFYTRAKPEMTEKDAATLAKLVAGCREQMESDLCELVDDLGPALTQEVGERDNGDRDPARLAAADALKLSLRDHWGKVAPALKAALAGRIGKGGKPGDGSAEA